jgi:hypothetical protein
MQKPTRHGFRGRGLHSGRGEAATGITVAALRDEELGEGGREKEEHRALIVTGATIATVFHRMAWLPLSLTLA